MNKQLIPKQEKRTLRIHDTESALENESNEWERRRLWYSDRVELSDSVFIDLASTSLASSVKEKFIEHLINPESESKALEPTPDCTSSSDSTSSVHKRSCKPSIMVANHCLSLREAEKLYREREERRGEGGEKARSMYSLEGNVFTCDAIEWKRYLRGPVSA